MCCVFRDAIVQTRVVISSYLNSWCLYGLQPVSRHQQGIFLLHSYHWVLWVPADHNPGGVCGGDQQEMSLEQRGPGRSHCSNGSTRLFQPSGLFTLEVPGLNSDLLSPSVIRSSLDRCSLTNEELRWMDEGLHLHCRFLLSHFAKSFVLLTGALKRADKFSLLALTLTTKKKKNDKVEYHH